MAVSDTLLSLIITLRYSLFYINIKAESINYEFKESLYFTTACMFSSFSSETLVTLLIISIERYRVTRTVMIPHPPSRRRGLAVIAGSWLVSMALGGLLLAAKQKQMKNNTKMLIFLCILVIFFITMILLNILTLRRISKPQAIENSLSEQHRQQRRNRIKSAVKMVLYSLLLYTCCYLPVLGLFPRGSQEFTLPFKCNRPSQSASTKYRHFGTNQHTRH